MRCRVMRGADIIGEVQFSALPHAPGAVAGPLEPAAAYGQIRDICRRSVDAIAAATDGGAGWDPDQDVPMPPEAMTAFLTALQAVGQLGLTLTDATGRPVPTVGVVSIQDYTGSTPDHRALGRGDGIYVAATLAHPDVDSGAADA